MKGGHDDPVAKNLGDPEKGPAGNLSAIWGKTIEIFGKRGKSNGPLLVMTYGCVVPIESCSRVSQIPPCTTGRVAAASHMATESSKPPMFQSEEKSVVDIWL